MKSGCLTVLTAMLLVAGCVNASYRLQPEDRKVGAGLEGSDCVPIILGLSAGDATLEAAMQNSDPPISRVREVRLHEYLFLVAGARCVEVIGDKGPAVAERKTQGD